MGRCDFAALFRTSLSAGMVSLFLVTVAAGGTRELNAVRGLWHLDGDLDPHWGCFSPISTGFAIGGVAPPAYRAIGGTNPQRFYADLPALSAAQSVDVPNIAAANGPAGAGRTNEWSLVFDVRVPTFPANATALVQTGVGDAELLISSGRQLELRGVVGGAVVVSDPLGENTWNRVALVANFNAALGRQELRVYVNGMVTNQTGAGQVQALPDGQLSLGATVKLFNDDDGETARLHVDSIGLWGLPLGGADVSVLGAYHFDGIFWPGMVASNRCPIPILTGALSINGFAGSHAPFAVDGLDPDPAVAGSVARILVTAGTLDGFPHHGFSGNYVGHVMADGEVHILDTVPIHYDGAGADRGELAGVVFVRDGIVLQTSGVATASSVKLYLPTGFGVAAGLPSEVLEKRVHDFATISNATLGPGLTPPANFTLRRVNFTSEGGAADPVYPIIDRVPVRFATDLIQYDAAAGTFSFSQRGGIDLIYHREFAVAFLGIFGSQMIGLPEKLRSNELYFLTAKDSPAPVVIGARADGTAALQAAEISLDPNKFGGDPAELDFHYPQMSVSWTQTAGSKLVFAGGEVDTAASQLLGAVTTESRYRQDVPPVNCDGEVGAPQPLVPAIDFSPAGGRWLFTPDGGLRAEGSGGVFVLRWGSYDDSAGNLRHAHVVTDPFLGMRAMTAGVFGRDSSGVAGVLLSGVGRPGDESLVERPGSPGYRAGFADYPGFNLRPEGASAISRINDQPTQNYQLSDDSKYVLRPGGVSGRHMAAPGTTIAFEAFGNTEFELSSFALGFRDSRNVSSGVAGGMRVPAPADFSLSFQKLLLGGQGQLQEAAIASGQGDKRLAEWDLKFTPLALGFTQPKVCPPASPDVGFVELTAQATLNSLTDTPLVGTIGLYDGNIVSKTAPLAGNPAVPVAQGIDQVSSFATAGNFSVNGPGGESWTIIPSSRVSVNRLEGSAGNWSEGTLLVGGGLDLPFFENMPVALSSTSSNSATGFTPLQYVRHWDGLEAAEFDPSHLGRPAGVSLATFRDGSAHDPRATRSWQDLIEFEFPVYLDPLDQRFRTRTAVTDDLFLFRLVQQVKTMSPGAAELTFDGALNLPQVSVASLLTGTELPGLPGGVKSKLDGALEGIGGLDALLADQLQDLLAGGVEGAVGGLQFDLAQLRDAVDRRAHLDGYAATVKAPLLGLVDGQWRTGMLAKVHDAQDGVADLQAIVDTAADLNALADAVSGIVSGGPRQAPPANRLGAIRDSVGGGANAARCGGECARDDWRAEPAARDQFPEW